MRGLMANATGHTVRFLSRLTSVKVYLYWSTSFRQMVLNEGLADTALRTVTPDI